jgi:hypothetical protein
LARIRSVKPEFWDDRKLAKRTSRDARLLYIGLWNLADEHARLNGDPQWIKGQIFSYDDDIDAAVIAKLLDELASPALGAVVPYEVDGDPYLHLPKLPKHQRLEPEKVKSRLPEPPAPGTDDPEPPPRPSAPKPDDSQPGDDSSESRADEYAPRTDEPEPGAAQSALLYVAGGRLHGAGGREVARAHAVPNAPQPAYTEVPDDFQPSDAMRRWAHSTHPGLDLDFETTQFKRHFKGEGKKKKSWVEPWQKWIADSHRRLMASRASPPTVGGRPGSAADQRRADVAQLRELDRRQREGNPPGTIQGSVIT